MAKIKSNNAIDAFKYHRLDVWFIIMFISIFNYNSCLGR
jgi:Ni,Fe-hydrogenase I cytochrome b subunit